LESARGPAVKLPNMGGGLTLVSVERPRGTHEIRLRTPVELGWRFGAWQVIWLGGWGRHRLCYLVMVVKLLLK
jgi:hypothetical protein